MRTVSPISKQGKEGGKKEEEEEKVLIWNFLVEFLQWTLTTMRRLTDGGTPLLAMHK